MSSLGPASHLEYFPIQFLQPQPPAPAISVPPQHQQLQQLQLQPRSAQPSPQPTEQHSSRLHAPTQPPPQVISPAPPFEWLLSTLTSILHSQHGALLDKLTETTNHQQSLVSKIEALERTSDTVQKTLNTALADIQSVSEKVLRLGTDMSSRDATLAERLNTLDDAVDTLIHEGRIVGASSPGQPNELRISLGLDVQPGGMPPAQPNEAPPRTQEGPGLYQGVVPEHIQRVNLPGFGNLSSGPPAQQQPRDVAPANGQNDHTEPILLASNSRRSTPQTPAKTRKRISTSQTQPATVRRSGRQSKKRQRRDGTIEQPIISKRAKRDSLVNGKATKKPNAPRNSTPDFDWSSIPILDEEMDQLILCDKCDRPYHLACVDIGSDDPILQADQWLCPPCAAGTEEKTATQALQSAEAGTCRPDCPAKGGAEVFAIESIIGRYPHAVDPSGIMMQYLIKWEGYPVARSTWTPENEIGQTARALIAAFEDAAKAEGLSIEDRSELILLAEARDAGWAYNVFPTW